jgi:hypothetical protein
LRWKIFVPVSAPGIEAIHRVPRAAMRIRAVLTTGGLWLPSLDPDKKLHYDTQPGALRMYRTQPGKDHRQSGGEPFGGAADT